MLCKDFTKPLMSVTNVVDWFGTISSTPLETPPPCGGNEVKVGPDVELDKGLVGVDVVEPP